MASHCDDLTLSIFLYLI